MLDWRVVISLWRVVISLLLGLLFSFSIWLAVPYNNFALNNSFISDSYLPEVVVLCLALMIFAVNPLLQAISPGLSLQGRHMAIICSMMLFAAILPSNGLFRFFPHALALNTQNINKSPRLAPAIAESDLPPQLFPDKIGRDLDTPNSDAFLDEIEEGKPIPWEAWVVPMFTWGILIVAFWLLMIGMGLMVFPQWLSVERLSFPLLRIYHAVLESPKGNHNFPPVFSSWLFWVGCLTVFGIHSLNGLNIFTGAVPSFPVSWNLSPYFTDGFWREMPGFIKSSRIYFVFVGLAFFMPNRFSFSIWFTILVFGIFGAYAANYMPTFNRMRFYDLGTGSIIAIAIGVVVLGWNQYKSVFFATFGIHDKLSRGTNNALSGRLFFGGAAIMYGWFLWAGVQPGWAAWYVLSAIIIMLVVTRIVAETGLTYVWIIPLTAERIASIFPSTWLTVSSAFMQGAHYILVNRASAVSAAAITVLSLGLMRNTPATQQRNLAGIGIVVLVLGFVVCGAVHLHMGHHFAESLDGKNQPITGRGANLMTMGPTDAVISGRGTNFDTEKATYIASGTLVAGILLFLCGRFHWWPLHPIGMIFVYSSIGLRLYMSLFIGWAIKTMLVNMAGARAYRIAMPLFLGLIVGEIFANAVWSLAPALLIWFGADPRSVERMVIFQYT